MQQEESVEFVVRPRKKEISGGVWELMRRGISKRVGKTRDQLVRICCHLVFKSEANASKEFGGNM
eukprot:2977453-Rhodomonas_salina.1